MSKAKGLHTFTVQEAQNATMGQAGTAYVKAASGAFAPTAASGLVVVAIQVLADATFGTLTPENADQCVGNSTTTAHTNDTSLSAVSIPSGITIYGRWTVVAPSAGEVICYLG